MDRLQVVARRHPALHLSLAVRRVRNVVTVNGELDLATAPRLARVLERMDASTRPVVLDVTTLRFVDSMGWAPVQAAQRRRRALGLTPVTVEGMSDRIARVVAVVESATSDVAG